MPQGHNAPPPAMTWGKALPVLIVAGIFDLARTFFTMFWFFGPALAATLCTVAGNSYLGTDTGSLVGKAVAGVCTVAAGVAGFFGAAPLEMFGVIMSMAVGLTGFLLLIGLLIPNMRRMLAANSTGIIWGMGGLALSEVPFISALPNFTLTLLKLYRTQIRIEKEARQQYERNIALEVASRLQQQQQVALLRQAEAKREAEEEEAQAARDARTDEALARYQEEKSAQGG